MRCVSTLLIAFVVAISANAQTVESGYATNVEVAAPGAGAASGQHNVYFDSTSGRLVTHKNGGSALIVNYNITHATDCTAVSAVGTGVALVAGDRCHELDDDTNYVYDGTAWDAIGAGGGGGDSAEIEDGDNAGTFTAIDTTARFDDSGDINFSVADGGAGGPDIVTATVRADSVALNTDTTGNYVQSITSGSGILGTVAAEGANAFLGLDYTRTLAADGSISVAGRCQFAIGGSNEGGFLCEGTTVDTQEQYHLFPPSNANDATYYIRNFDRKEFVAGSCQNGVAALAFNSDANAPAPACVTGTNTVYAEALFDAATDEYVSDRFWLPVEGLTQITLDIFWRAAATSGDVVWALETACNADAETGDPTWNTAQTVTDTAKGTTLQWNTAQIATVTLTGCAADEMFHWRFRRDADNGSDTMTGDAGLMSVRFTIR